MQHWHPGGMKAEAEDPKKSHSLQWTSLQQTVLPQQEQAGH